METALPPQGSDVAHPLATPMNRTASAAGLIRSSCKAAEQFAAQPPWAEGAAVNRSYGSGDAPLGPRALAPRVGLQRRVTRPRWAERHLYAPCKTPTLLLPRVEVLVRVL